MFKFKITFVFFVIANCVFIFFQPVLANTELNALSINEKYWVMPNGGYDNKRYSKLDQINSKNVNQLKLHKKIKTGVKGVHAGQPLVIPGKLVAELQGDLLIISTPFPNKVMAINLDTYNITWEYIPEQDEELLQYQGGAIDQNLGVVYVDGKIVLQQRDTKLVVLNATTGKEIWSIRNGSPGNGESNINSPIIIKNMIITGNDGSEFGIRGHLTAYKLSNGERLWRAYSTGSDSDMLLSKWQTMEQTKKINEQSGVKSWKEQQYLIGGSTTEGWYAYDPDLELIYYGTSAPGSWNPYHRPGSNKWSNSIIARDVNTGVAKWVYQMTPHDSWAYDGTNEMTLLEQEIDGLNRKILVHFDQNGFVYKLDRESGELLSAEKYHEDTNWAHQINLTRGRPVLNNKYNPGNNGEDVITKDICPSAAVRSASNKGMSTYNPKTSLMFTSIGNVCMTYEPVSFAAGGNHFKLGLEYVNANITLYPSAAVYNKEFTQISELIAWDLDKNKVRWSIPETQIISGGVFSTAGDLVFYGTTNGYMNIIHAETGKLLWAYDAGGSITGGVSSWMHQGKQYIGFMIGDKDNASLGYSGQTDGELLVFSLP